MRHTLISAALLMTMAASPVLSQPYGMGPGAMGRGGGYGMGAGMMGGYGQGGYGMGPGMMGGGYAAEALLGLDLSAEQRKQIAQIQEESAKSRWQLMGAMHSQESHMHGMFGPGPLDEEAARKAFESMASTQKAMFELSLGARKRIDAILTPGQREQLRRYWAGR